MAGSCFLVAGGSWVDQVRVLELLERSPEKTAIIEQLAELGGGISRAPGLGNFLPQSSQLALDVANFRHRFDQTPTLPPSASQQHLSLRKVSTSQGVLRAPNCPNFGAFS